MCACVFTCKMWVGGSMHAMGHGWKSSDSFGDQFSPCTMMTLGIKLGSSGLSGKKIYLLSHLTGLELTFNF